MYIPDVPSYRTLLPILPYTILPSRLYPNSIPSYPPHTFNTPRFPSIYILFHSTLSYSSVPYPKLLHPTPTETRPKWLMAERLVLLGQIDQPSGDKADTTRRKWLMAKDLPTFRHQVVLVTRDFCPRPGALWGAVLLFISYVWISKIHFRMSIIHFWISIIHFWISKNEFRISTNRFLDIHNSFLDIQKYIKIHFWISKSHAEYWISIIRFLDIQKSVYFKIS